MSSGSLAPLARPSPKAVVSPKVRRACDYMVHEGIDWQDAAIKAGLTTQAMRLALGKPATMQYLKTAREVFRASISAANVHRAAEIRDTSRNHTAAIQAIRYLDNAPEESARGAAARTPGVVIVIGQQPNSEPVTIDVHTQSVDSVSPAGDDNDH